MGIFLLIKYSKKHMDLQAVFQQRIVNSAFWDNQGHTAEKLTAVTRVDRGCFVAFNSIIAFPFLKKEAQKKGKSTLSEYNQLSGRLKKI